MGRRGRDQAGRAGEWKNLKMEVTFWKRHRFRSKVAAPTQARDHVERKPISLVNRPPGKKAKVSQKKPYQLLEDTNSTSARNTKENLKDNRIVIILTLITQFTDHLGPLLGLLLLPTGLIGHFASN